MPGLGRILQDDPRNRQYPLRALLAAEPAPTRAVYHHRTGPILDQDDTGTCVGHAWRQWYTSALIMGKGGPSQWDIYLEACKRDPWTQNDRGDLHFGTSVLAAAQYLHELGIASEYRWTWRASEAATWLLLGRGVLVAGINWFSGQTNPDKHHVMHPTGTLQGGHAIVISGYNRKRGLFRFCNSWGVGWAEKGRAWMSGEDFQRLLDQDGECCLAVQSDGRWR